jgi:hypothetical protein
MMGLAFEAVLVAGVLAAGVGRLRRLLGWLALDPAEVASWHRRAGGGAREALREALRSEVESDEPLGSYARLAEALAEAEPRQQAAGCNEALLELEGGLAAADEGGGLLRLLVLGTLLALVVGFGEGASGGEMLGVLALGGGGWGVLGAASRGSRAVVEAWRRGVDAWVEEALRGSGQGAARKVDGRRRSV